MANYRLRIGQTTGYPLLAEAGGYALSGQNSTLTYAGVPASDPYIWYPALDKASIPFHASSGFWGVQSTIKEASAPTGAMTDVTAANAAELATHIYTPNRRITLTGNVLNGVFNDGNVTDVDIIVPPGILMSGCAFGKFDLTTTTTRLRIRGPTVGSYSGGQVHSTSMFGPCSDIIFDGVAMSGTAAACAFIVQGTAARLAISNVRANCGGYFYIGTADDPTFTNCSIQTGMDVPAQLTGDEEAWGCRFAHETGGNIVVYNCDIRSNPARSVNSHARIRMHPDPDLAYAWISGNNFVERVESWLMWVNAASGGGTGTADCVWYTNNSVVASSTGSGGTIFSITGSDTTHAVVTGNSISSNTILSDANLNLSGTSTTTESGNSYSSLPGSDPAWGAAGDPTGIDWTP